MLWLPKEVTFSLCRRFEYIFNTYSDPLLNLDPFGTEFVVSPTHDYTTFSSYGSDVYTCVQFNLNFSFLSFFFCSFGDAGMLQFSFSLIFSVPFYCMF